MSKVLNFYKDIKNRDRELAQKIFDYIEQEPKEWKEFIEVPDNPDEMKGIREKTRTGRPLGTNDFIESLEGQLKRLFKLRPKGRPKKKVNK